MGIGLRMLLLGTSILTMIYIIRKIRSSKLQIEYTVFWIFFAGLLVFFAAFPKVVFLLSDFLGIDSPANFIFVFVIFILLIKMFMMTIELSQLQNKIYQLTQEVAIKNKENDEE